MEPEAAWEILLDVVRAAAKEAVDSLAWFDTPVVVARGHYAPERFDFIDAVESADIEAAWDEIAEPLSEHELLYMDGMGGHPGGGWAEVIRAHDFADAIRIYSWETDIADMGQQGTFLIAMTQAHNVETDARVVESALSVDGCGLAYAALGGTLNELRTVVPRPRIVQALVAALADIEASEDIEQMAEDAPEDLEPNGADWWAWVINAYLPQ